ncbi:hypothetical protein D3C76_724290 [compost metagenome]
MSVAVILASPTLTPVASPPMTVATPVASLPQLAVSVMSWVLLSDSWAVAVSCTLSPAGTVAGSGVTTTPITAASPTVSEALSLRKRPLTLPAALI